MVQGRGGDAQELPSRSSPQRGGGVQHLSSMKPQKCPETFVTMGLNQTESRQCWCAPTASMALGCCVPFSAWRASGCVSIRKLLSPSHPAETGGCARAVQGRAGQARRRAQRMGISIGPFLHYWGGCGLGGSGFGFWGLRGGVSCFVLRGLGLSV